MNNVKSWISIDYCVPQKGAPLLVDENTLIETDPLKPFTDWVTKQILVSPVPPTRMMEWMAFVGGAYGAVGPAYTGWVQAYLFVMDQVAPHMPKDKAAQEALAILLGICSVVALTGLTGPATRQQCLDFANMLKKAFSVDMSKLTKNNQAALRMALIKVFPWVTAVFAAMSPAWATEVSTPGMNDIGKGFLIASSVFGGAAFKYFIVESVMIEIMNRYSEGKTASVVAHRRMIRRALANAYEFAAKSNKRDFQDIYGQLMDNSKPDLDRTLLLFTLSSHLAEKAPSKHSKVMAFRWIATLSGIVAGGLGGYAFYLFGKGAAEGWIASILGLDEQEQEGLVPFFGSLIACAWVLMSMKEMVARCEGWFDRFFDPAPKAEISTWILLRKLFSLIAWICAFGVSTINGMETIRGTEDEALFWQTVLSVFAFVVPTCVYSRFVEALMNGGWDQFQEWYAKSEVTLPKQRDMMTNMVKEIDAQLRRLPDNRIEALHATLRGVLETIKKKENNVDHTDKDNNDKTDNASGGGIMFSQDGQSILRNDTGVDFDGETTLDSTHNTTKKRIKWGRGGCCVVS